VCFLLLLLGSSSQIQEWYCLWVYLNKFFDEQDKPKKAEPAPVAAAKKPAAKPAAPKKK